MAEAQFALISAGHGRQRMIDPPPLHHLTLRPINVCIGQAKAAVKDQSGMAENDRQLVRNKG